MNLRAGVPGLKLIPPIGKQDANPAGEISLPLSFSEKFSPFVQPAIQYLLRWPELNQLYTRVSHPDNQGQIWASILRSLNVMYEVSSEDLANVPKSGPLVVVANHPYGGIEGVMLAALLCSVRRDVKVLANQVLWSFPALRESLIPVDPFGEHSSKLFNIRGLKAAIQWLRQGGALVIFPAGEVAHFDVNQFEIADPHWHDAVSALVRKTSAATLPVFFDGSNGPFFHLLGMVHPLLRTMMLPSELLNKKNQAFKVRIGRPISHLRLREFVDDAESTRYLRWRTYLLGCREKTYPHPKLSWYSKTSRRKAVVQSTPSESKFMEKEINNLPAEQILLDNGGDAVVVARAAQMPHVLQEIGRLREIAFRAVGEGTGREKDLDSYDEYYDHLFLWRRADGQILGAYRLGLTERIVADRGKRGLYTSTLFDYEDRFFRRLGPSLELGRSFVRLEYQGTLNTLPLLWRGIGQYLLQHPECKTLFGPVSISNAYHPISQRMMVSYLHQNHQTLEISRLLKPKTPFKTSRLHPRNPQPLCFDVKNVEELSALISEIETDRKRVPILLKHYLKLGGKVVGFNVDRDFSHVLDGLIVVDLTQTDRRILERVLGPDGAQRFLAHHAIGASSSEPPESPAAA